MSQFVDYFDERWRFPRDYGTNHGWYFNGDGPSLSFGVKYTIHGDDTPLEWFSQCKNILAPSYNAEFGLLWMPGMVFIVDLINKLFYSCVLMELSNELAHRYLVTEHNYARVYVKGTKVIDDVLICQLMDMIEALL